MMSQCTVLLIENLSHQYAVGNTPLPVLQNINLSLMPGETVAIVGPSGSGKSTLLNIAGTLDTATSGTVRIANEDVSTLSDAQRALLRNRVLGFVFQQHHLLPQCTALENVLVPTIVNASPEAHDRAVNLLERVGLKDRMNQYPAQLSGGEQQRVAVARALINCPQLLLADEPTGSLDQTHSDQLCELLLELNQSEGVALLMVTHALRQAAKMNTVYELVDGQLVESRTP